jgi:hypothetical protein
MSIIVIVILIYLYFFLLSSIMKKEYEHYMDCYLLPLINLYLTLFSEVDIKKLKLQEQIHRALVISAE